MTSNKIKKRTGKTVDQFLLDNISCIVAFIIPVTIMILIYIIRDIYPFGTNCYLRSDMYHQYAPFYQELYYKLKNGGSLTYSWDIGMGINFTALYAYYLASPVNFLLRFLPENHMIEIMSILIITKIGLSGASFAYYISRHFKTKHISVAAFAIFYSLSSYLAAYSWNIMWLDCMVLLPIIILGLERLVKENKCFLYCISLGLCIYSNYYIAIMICIFCFLYFWVVLFSEKPEHDNNYYGKRIFHFILYSLLAGGFAACLILPVFNALQMTASGDMEFPETLSRYFSVIYMLSRSMMNVPTAIFEAHDPNLYSTVGIFLLLPLYWMNKFVNPKEKIGKTLLFVFFIISFNMNIPNFIWHGLHFPNSLPCRESFIYIFLTLVMSYEAFKGLKTYTNKQIYGTFGGVVALILLIEQFRINDTYDFSIIYMSLAFVALYLLLIVVYRSNSYQVNYIVYLLFVVTIAEATINTEETAISTTDRTSYVIDNTEITSLLDQVSAKDSSFYRIEKDERRTKNDAAWHQYMGVSTFSSTASAPLTDYLGLLGFEKSTNAYAFYGNTPLTASLLSVKYMFYNTLQKESDMSTLFAQNGDRYLYQNTYTLPLGFMLKADFDKTWITDDTNPFRVQNNFAETVTGFTNMFEPISTIATGKSVKLNITNSNPIYAYVTTSEVETVYVSILDANGTLVDSKTFTGLKHSHIINLGSAEPGSTVTITTSDNVTGMLLYAYSFNEDIFKSVYTELNRQPYVIETFEDTYIKGSITAENDGLMYTSIPYEEGWTVKVDGKEVETKAFKKALVSVPLTAGTHTVEFSYSPKGFKTGIIISIFSILVFAGIVISFFWMKRKFPKDTQNEEIVVDQDVIATIMNEEEHKKTTE